ncbi:MAG: flagellar biosynthesis protein FlhF [Rhodocyclaceae bacterium]
MNVKRYFGKTARDALRELKAELGADAIVLSNRAVPGGVEILALPSEAVGAFQAAAAAPQRAAPAPAAPEEAGPGFATDEDDYRVSLSAMRAQPSRAVATANAEPLRAGGLRERQVAEADRSQQGGGRAERSHEFSAHASILEPAPVVRPFQPPRVETADYLMRQAPYPDEILISRPDVARDEPPAAAARKPQAAHRAPIAESASDGELSAGATSAAAVSADRARRDEVRIQALQEANAKLMDELGSIRGMIERQLAGFAWGETRKKAPARAEIVGELLEAGFSSTLARELADAVGDDATLEAARATVKQLLARDMRAMSSDADLIDQGGVYALVGPTGVGKTTTTAKIAARFVVRHGAERLALITTDGYRIGAQEQLRIYGRILGVPVFPVRDASELRQTLGELRNKHMVLIDTVGMSQRDRMVAQQAAMLSGAGNVRRLLLLNATCRGDTLDDVIRAYRGPDLAGCVFTKVDEAASLAPAIGAAIAHELEVFYVTNGQRVPEDLHLPNRAYLLHRALRARGEDSPWRLRDDEAALMMAAGMER